MSPTIRDGEVGEMPIIVGETVGAWEMSGDNRCGGNCGTELGNLCFKLADGFLICSGLGDDCFSQVLGHFTESLNGSIGAQGMKDVEGRLRGDGGGDMFVSGVGWHQDGVRRQQGSDCEFFFGIHVNMGVGCWDCGDGYVINGGQLGMGLGENKEVRECFESPLLWSFYGGRGATRGVFGGRP